VTREPRGACVPACGDWLCAFPWVLPVAAKVNPAASIWERAVASPWLITLGTATVGGASGKLTLTVLPFATWLPAAGACDCTLPLAVLLDTRKDSPAASIFDLAEAYARPVTDGTLTFGGSVGNATETVAPGLSWVPAAGFWLLALPCLGSPDVCITSLAA